MSRDLKPIQWGGVSIHSPTDFIVGMTYSDIWNKPTTKEERLIRVAVVLGVSMMALCTGGLIFFVFLVFDKSRLVIWINNVLLSPDTWQEIRRFRKWVDTTAALEIAASPKVFVDTVMGTPAVELYNNGDLIIVSYYLNALFHGNSIKFLSVFYGNKEDCERFHELVRKETARRT